MPPSSDQSYIEQLKKSLYSRNAPDVRTRRKLRFSDAPEENSEVKTDWEHPKEKEEPVVLNKKYEDHKMSFFGKFLIASLIFCVIALGVGAFLFFNGANLISANNIDIRISGPVSVSGGDTITFDIDAVNKNNVDLQLVDMNVEFPPGTTDPSNPGQTLKTYTKLIGNIKSGGSAHESVKAIIFGEENLQKQILVTMTYSVKGSTAVFTKQKSYDVIISSSPINLTVNSFKEVTSDQEFDIKLNVKSNSKDVLRNVLLKANYPFGYTLINSTPATFGDNRTWKIGDIPAGSTRTVTLHGKLTGEDTDLRAFHFSVGAQNPKDVRSIGTEYMALEQDITIQKPFISLDISVGGDAGKTDYAGRFDQRETVQINWFNNLSETVSNVQIKAKLSGNAYDKNTVSPDAGYFSSGSDEIIWNQQTNPELKSVAAGANGRVLFTIVPKDLGSATNPVVNPNLVVSANVSGNRTQESNVPVSVTAGAQRKIVVSSNVILSGRVVRTVGPFSNTGPIPPKVDKPTTYTIIWDVDNTSNSVNNAEVTASLPTYVKWLGVVSPTSEKITYDENSGKISWNIGNVAAYTLNSSRRREVAFQVVLTPSLTQAGQPVTLVNNSTLTATDDFTGVQLQSAQDTLTTRFSTDPGYVTGNEIVVK